MPGGFCVQRYPGEAPQRPPGPVLPVKSVAGRARGDQVNSSTPRELGTDPASAPPGPRYHDTACVPGSGKRAKDCSNAGSGAPGCEPPAPLSNRILTGGSASNAASAAAYDGSSWIGSLAGKLTPLTPIATS